MDVTNNNSIKELAKERLEKLKKSIVKNSIKLFYNDEDRGQNCFEQLKFMGQKICTEMGKGDEIEDHMGLTAGRHMFWDNKTYSEHCISEFSKKHDVDLCENLLVDETQTTSLSDEL